jgi:hypothetical protein
VRKTLSRDVLLNPLRLNGVLEIATSSLQVDEGLTFGELRELALRFRLRRCRERHLHDHPDQRLAGRREGQSVVLIDDAAAAGLFEQIARDVPPGAQEPPARPDRRRSR